MNSFSSISFLVLFGLVRSGSGWVFTDFNYNELLKAHGVNQEESEMSDDALTHLKFGLMYPGTKWCGPGNIADNYDDLGPEEVTDMCCRAHDYCPDLMHALESKYNLTNTAFYTRLNCDCDEEFRSCLHAANSTVSTQIGYIYFNGLGNQCFRKDYPVTGCRRRGGWLNAKCLEYYYNTNGTQKYQWFDVPPF